jgi:all-trans-retinol 13,14-reductase
MKYDYVVIGAGVSGISSALLLARFGFKVALLEQASRPAPLIDGFVRNGVYFEGGFHYAGGLERGGVLDRNLRLLGIADDLQRAALDETAYDTVIQPENGFEFSFPQGYSALQTTLQQQFLEQSLAIVDYLKSLQVATENLPYYNALTSLSPLRLAELHGQSLEDVLDDFGFSGDLRNLLQVHCLLYGARPEEIPFAIHAGVVDGYYRSAATFKGGGWALVKALAVALKRGGVDLYCRHQVTEV